MKLEAQRAGGAGATTFAGSAVAGADGTLFVGTSLMVAFASLVMESGLIDRYFLGQLDAAVYVAVTEAYRL